LTDKTPEKCDGTAFEIPIPEITKTKKIKIDNYDTRKI